MQDHILFEDGVEESYQFTYLHGRNVVRDLVWWQTVNCHTHDLQAASCETFEQLVEAVTQAGKADASIRDLEAKNEQLTQRLSSNNIEQIEKDLAQVKEDNHKLIKKLKS